jgi:hypothetical protein
MDLLLFLGMISIKIFLTKRQGNIEDYLGSKQKDLKNFKENLLVFLDSLILECQDGPLFDQVFMEKCIDYVIALSWLVFSTEHIPETRQYIKYYLYLCSIYFL